MCFQNSEIIRENSLTSNAAHIVPPRPVLPAERNPGSALENSLYLTGSAPAREQPRIPAALLHWSYDL